MICSHPTAMKIGYFGRKLSFKTVGSFFSHQIVLHSPLLAFPLSCSSLPRPCCLCPALVVNGLVWLRHSSDQPLESYRLKVWYKGSTRDFPKFGELVFTSKVKA